ncbi:type I-F CRISPR-associated protein Csy1 [Endozoicomonas acroporae]|uniref:type I-F CRISPR-associated protein Csy1 n=1 Tax=Endozoicomonas acroporae TaxID=1701104 RepID=UPI000C793B72|nr:type I-F CRISPR-associated protein Csy1 [Endozoicomonas acroporae]
MESITRDDVIQAIDQYLSEQLQSKLEPEQKKLDKAEPGSDQAQKISDKITDFVNRYDRANWMETLANKYTGQIKFGTHISKGVHPDSKGDNINFRPSSTLPAGIVGTQCLSASALDANGNAAALPLVAFFNISVNGVLLRDLILANLPGLEKTFATDPALSAQYQQKFYASLAAQTDSPTTSGRNKQLLWPRNNAIAEDNYHCLVPLHPSALINNVSGTIYSKRFSEENKNARDNRKKKSVEQKAYVSVISLAALKIGGSNPQNISSLTSKQRGVNLLLESLPPTYSRQQDFSLSKRQESFFSRSLAYHCYEALQMLYAVIEAANSNKDIRDQRKEALDLILGQILQMAAYVQQSFPAGWSENYQLKMAHKLWLDPLRANQEGQTAFKHQREKGEWVQSVMQDFSLWLNNLLHTRFKKQATDFDDVEFREWRREMEATIKASQRNNAGIFS